MESPSFGQKNPLTRVFLCCTLAHVRCALHQAGKPGVQFRENPNPKTPGRQAWGFSFLGVGKLGRVTPSG
jgi:hypothetical protein